MSAAMASCAARLISAGAGKSGKPCERLTAPCCNARRVISRITDSVNCSALRESLELTGAPGPDFAGFILGTIQSAVDVRVSRYDLNVLARFGERNRLHKFRRLAIILPSRPRRHTIFARIIRS